MALRLCVYHHATAGCTWHVCEVPCVCGLTKACIGQNAMAHGIERCGSSGCLLPDKRFASAYSDCDLCLAFCVPTASTKLINY